MHVAVEHFHVLVGFDLVAHHLTGVIHLEAGDAGAFADHLERDLLEVEDDVGGVLDHAGNGAEFVRDAFDADGGDGRAFDRAEQHAAQTGSDGGSESTLERLRGEHAVALVSVSVLATNRFGFWKPLNIDCYLVSLVG